MTDRESIERDVDVYAEDFVDKLFEIYQSFAYDTIPFEELLDLGLTNVKEYISAAKNFKWEE